MAERSTRFRRTMMAFGVGTAALVTAAGAGLFWLQSESGRYWIARSIEAAASTPGELEITIGNLDGPLPHTIRLSDVVLADAKGSWLRVDQAVIEWRPLSLLSKRLVVRRIHVANLAVERLPETPSDDSAPTERFAIPTLPVGIKLRDLKIDSLQLGEAVLGAPAALRVSAAARSNAEDKLIAKLSVTRLDGPAGQIEGTAAFDPKTEELSIDVALQEPEGGLIARLLEIDGLPPLGLTASGNGRLDDWQGTLSSTIGDLATVEAKVGLTGHDERRVTVAGTAALARISDELPWPLLRGDIDFDLLSVWDGADTLRIENAQIASNALDFDLAGTVDLDRQALQAEARITLRQMSDINQAIEPARLSGLHAILRAEGPLLRPKATLDATARGLEGPGLIADRAILLASLEPDGSGPGPAMAGALTLDLSLSGLVVEPAIATAPIIGPIIGTTPKLSANGRLDLASSKIDLDEFQIVGAAARVEGHGTVGLDSGTAELSLSGGLEELAALEPLLGLALDGRMAFRADVDVRDFGESLTASLEGAAPGLAFDVFDARALLGPEPLFGADFAFDSDQRLQVNALRFEGDQVWLAGDATIDTASQTVEANISLGLDSLEALGDSLDTALAGQVAVNAHALGSIDDPRLQGDILAENIVADGAQIGDIALSYTARNLASDPKGTIDLELTNPIANVVGTTDFVLSEDAVTLSDIDLTGPATRARGQLRLSLEESLVAGQIDATVASLAPLFDRAGLAGDGAASARVTLSGRNGRQSLAVDSRITDIRYELGGPDDLTADRIDAVLRVDDLETLGDGRLDAQIANLSLGEIDIAAADVSLTGAPNDAGFEVRARGDAFGDLRLNSAGRVSIDGENLRVRVDRLDGEALGEALGLGAAATVEAKGNDLSIDDLDLRFGAASITASARLTAERLRATLAIAGLPLSLIRTFTRDSDIDGILTANLQIEGPRSAPDGNGQLSVAELRVSDAAELPPLSAESAFALRDGRLTVTAGLAGFASQPLELAADIPFALDPDSLAPVISEAAQISGTAAWQGKANELWAFVPVDGHLVSGDTNIDVDLAGSLSDPRLSGAIGLTAGAYENLTTGTLLKDLELAVAFDGEQARIVTLNATDGESGRLSGSGSVDFDPDRDFPFETAVTFQDFTLLRRDDVTAIENGRIAVSGSLRSAAISGQLTAKTVEVVISNDLPPDVVNLAVIEVNAESIGRATPDQSTDAPSGPEIPLDLRLTFPGQVYVRGLGLDSEWAGEITVTGTAAAPLVDGALAVRKGQLSLLAQTFELSKGTVSFTGEEKIDPFLDIEATSKKSELTAIVAVSGPASRPTIALRSIPELPQDEVIARVLFGKSTGQLSPFEALQLAEAAAEFSGQGSTGGGVLDFTRNLLGLDVLRVGSNDGDSAAPTVSAGQYVTDRVYVGVKQGTSPGSSSVGVEVELTPNIAVTSDVGQTGESDIGINFQWDY